MPLMDFTAPPDQGDQEDHLVPTAPGYDHGFPFPDIVPIFDWTPPRP